MKKCYIVTTFLLCLLTLAGAAALLNVREWKPPLDTLTIGFVYEEDESVPNTYNFHLAQDAIEKEYGDRVRILSRSNVLGTEAESTVRDLIRSGCQLLFTNTRSDQISALAAEYPDVQFCQVSYREMNPEEYPDNYHTFYARIHQGRYVSGIVAGLKLRELIETGEITPEEALVGYVGAQSAPEVISGFTAFILGVRSIVPEAVLRVRYTGSWSDYAREKECAGELIGEGCVILSHHTNTTGSAVACEEASVDHPVFHVGYNESMMDVAPVTALAGIRINWTPYILGATEAVLAGRAIEQMVPGDAHGRDLCAGFDEDWVEMLELNSHLAAAGTQEAVEEAIRNLERGKLEVFSGDYKGVNPQDPSDTCDLNQAYVENKEYSLPSFRYLLEGVVTVEE